MELWTGLWGISARVHMPNTRIILPQYLVGVVR